MTDPQLLEFVRPGLNRVLGELPDLHWVRTLAGGDINKAALIASENNQWFLKYHRAAPVGMFAAEAQALSEISKQKCIQVPTPVVHGNDGDTAWLVLEYLDLKTVGPASTLGEQLAALHKVTFNRYGWTRDNYIGTTAQANTQSNDWTTFWRDCRLKPQFGLAEAAGHSGRLLNQGEELLADIEQLMNGHQPDASLLHGDLWGGNKAYTTDGLPVIFDPASYYGDRETDIAMTRLFGGFDPDFYSAYQAHFPLPDGFQLRQDLYNLYHVLNHLNLFGGAYLSRAENMITALLTQLR